MVYDIHVCRSSTGITHIYCIFMCTHTHINTHILIYSPKQLGKVASFTTLASKIRKVRLHPAKLTGQQGTMRSTYKTQAQESMPDTDLLLHRAPSQHSRLPRLKKINALEIGHRPSPHTLPPQLLFPPTTGPIPSLSVPKL